MKILVEASGSLTSGYLMKSIKESGYQCVASDISSINHSQCLADERIIFPKAKDPNLWKEVERLLEDNNINVVIPSLDETLLGWSERKSYFKDKGVTVITSDSETISIFQDKWKTYEFFTQVGIQTPKSSLEENLGMTKPRDGRGAVGISFDSSLPVPENYISQEVVTGQEYTIDCLFDSEGKAQYIVPRKRIDIKEGKSTKGVVELNSQIDKAIHKMADSLKFQGPINFQCFIDGSNEPQFIEINPRIAGGMALGFAATENWIPLLINDFVNGLPMQTQGKVKNNLMMVRYYSECFFEMDSASGGPQ